MVGPCAFYSLCWNLSPTSKDEFAGAAPIKGSDTPTPTFVVSRAPTPAFATVLAAAPSLDNKLFK